MIDLRVRLGGLDEFARVFGPGLATRPMRRTLDREATATRKDLVLRVAAETTMRTPAINRRLKVARRTTQEDLTAIIEASRSGVPISEYKPKTARRKVEVRADISAEAGEGVRTLKYGFHPRGHPVKKILERVRVGGRRVGRYPLKTAYGPSVATHVEKLWPEQEPVTAARVVATYRAEFAIEVERRQRRQGQSAR